jgi:hypothetical protein
LEEEIFSLWKRLLEKNSNSNLGLIIEQGLLTFASGYQVKTFPKFMYKRRTLPLLNRTELTSQEKQSCLALLK